MAKERKTFEFFGAKGDIVENLRAIRMSLVRCIEEGMIDEDDTYYNQVVLLIDEASISRTWDELMEVVAKAKILEVDVAAWLAGHGQTSLSLPWPRPPKKSE